jgi:urease accessory protein UreF
MLLSLRPALVAVVASASTCSDDDLTTQAPGYAITSARHESQYSRLFRS